MNSPFTGKEMIVAKEYREMAFRNEVFQVFFHSYLCKDTGEKFEDNQFSILNYNQVVNQHRNGHNQQTPD